MIFRHIMIRHISNNHVLKKKKFIREKFLLLSLSLSLPLLFLDEADEKNSKKKKIYDTNNVREHVNVELSINENKTY